MARLGNMKNKQNYLIGLDIPILLIWALHIIGMILINSYDINLN